MIEIKDKGLVADMVTVKGYERIQRRLKDVNGLSKGSFDESSLKVLNYTDVSHSMRFNPIQHKYIPTIQDALALSEKMMDCIEPFINTSIYNRLFREANVNLLAACIHFFVNYEKMPYREKGIQLWPEYIEDPETHFKRPTGRVFENEEFRNKSQVIYNRYGQSEIEGMAIPKFWLGKYSDLPHIMAFLMHDYWEIIEILRIDPELHPLIDPFKTAYDNKDLELLDGMIISAKVLLGKIHNKEVFWIMNKDGDDFDLTDKEGSNNVLTICKKGNESLMKILSIVNTGHVLEEIHEQTSRNRVMEALLDIEPYKFESTLAMQHILQENYRQICQDVNDMIHKIQTEFN